MQLIIDGALFRKNYDNVFLRCLEKPDVDKVLAQLHDGPAGGYFGGEMNYSQDSQDGYFGLPYSEMLIHMLENVNSVRHLQGEKINYFSIATKLKLKVHLNNGA
jgi:hypothetical protein